MSNELQKTDDRTKTLLKKVTERVPQYHDSAETFIQHCEARGYTMESFREYIDGLKNEGKLRPSTINLRMTAAKAVIRELVESDKSLTVAQRYDMERTLRTVKPLKTDKTVQDHKTISKKEYETFIENAPKRIATIVRLLWKTGLRISEALGLRLDRCVNTGTHIEATVVGKGLRERTVKIPLDLFRECRDVFEGTVYLIETKKGEQMDRTYVGTELRVRGQAILGKKLSPHMLRHTFATNTLKKTKDLSAVSKYLGHSSVRTTGDMYVHTTLELDDLPDG